MMPDLLRLSEDSRDCISISVQAAFYLMFRRIVDRYCDRIAALPEKVKIWQTFPTRGWILLVFMMGPGSALKHIPGVPSAYSVILYRPRTYAPAVCRKIFA